MIEIDGSVGEGGGQILRTALSLSCACGTPFRMVNIRRNRKRPGLMPQHLTAVRAAGRISGAEVSGDHPGSVTLSFAPGRATGGEYAFDVGTAGSTLLVFQTLLLPLLLAKRQSALTLTGGTHVPFSPSFHYVSSVFLTALARMGGNVELSIVSFGFFPRGGGTIRAIIHPAGKILPLRAEERGRVLSIDGCSAAGRLPRDIAVRQRDAAQDRLRAGIGDIGIPLHIELSGAPTPGRGTFIFLRANAENIAAGFTALGGPGKRAEAVGKEAAEEMIAYLDTGAALDPHLPDQLVPYMALCGEESVLTTSRVTPHLQTNLQVTGLFRNYSRNLEGETGKPGRLAVRGEPHPANRGGRP